MASTTVDEQTKQDVAVLADLGYKQEFKRDFRPAEVFGFAFGLLGVVPSVASVLFYALPNGGPVAMVWGWAASVPFLFIIGMAMAELGSAMPMSGGLYFWTYRYSSPRWRNLLSWIVGYTNSAAYISGVAGIDFGCAQQIMAAASIGSDLNFAPTIHQTFGVYCAILICHGTIVSMKTKVIAKLTVTFIILNICLWLALVIGFPAATSSEFKNPASFALGSFQNLNGWPNGYGFILSLLTPLWVVSGFDSSVHISEEARNAKVAVPWTIMTVVAMGSLLGFVLNLVMVFNMGTDLLDILGSPIGQPFAAILLNSFGKKGSLAIWSFVIISQFMAGISILTVSSRLNWAFARDNGLPFSRYLYRVNESTRTPVVSVWASVLCAALLSLISFAGEDAISAIFTLGVVAQYVGNLIPIAARHLGGVEFKPGPFYLGIFSKPIGLLAVAWMAFMAIVLLFPTTPETNAQEMNYTVVVYGGVLVLALAYYYFPVYGGVHWFTGPVRTIEYEESKNAASLSTSESFEADEKGEKSSQ